MNPEAQRIAIAEWCGWTECTGHLSKSAILNGIKTPLMICPKSGAQEFIPDYLNDLNAMHEAEEKLVAMDYQWRNRFAGQLHDLLEREILKADPTCAPDVLGFEWIHATAAQRAEALLRTIGKWKDGCTEEGFAQ